MWEIILIAAGRNENEERKREKRHARNSRVRSSVNLTAATWHKKKKEEQFKKVFFGVGCFAEQGLF